jgi:hypothetical protein
MHFALLQSIEPTFKHEFRLLDPAVTGEIARAGSSESLPPIESPENP